MKIYIVTYDSAFDFETAHYIVGAYTNVEKAKEVLESEIAKLNTNGYKVEKDIRSFEMWKDGCYNEDHVSIEIRASELDFDFRLEYWKEIAESHLEVIQTDLEGDYSNLSQEKIDTILETSANEFLNNDNAWDVIDETIHRIVEENAESVVKGGK